MGCFALPHFRVSAAWGGRDAGYCRGLRFYLPVSVRSTSFAIISRVNRILFLFCAVGLPLSSEEILSICRGKQN